MADGTWIASVQCTVIALTYDFVNREGRLVMAKNNCCDMDGCINLFTDIDPEVRMIETFAGDLRDTLYLRSRDKWVALTSSSKGWEK
jgi:hypothetical protein